MRHYVGGKCRPKMTQVNLWNHLQHHLEHAEYICIACSWGSAQCAPRWGFSLIFGIYGSVFPYAFIMAVV